MISSDIYAEDVASGTYGDNLTWVLDDEGTLTISGTGDMQSYKSKYHKNRPWYSKLDLIKKIVIQKGVTSIGDYAFYSCENLKSIKIPDSVTHIGYCAFGGCTSLSGITIPDSVTSIDYFTFWHCKSLTSVTLSNNVPIIGRAMFFGCTSLTNVTIPNGVTMIYQDAFGNCSSLCSVTIPDSVTNIDYYAFQNCSSLASVTLPDSMVVLGGYSFRGCTSLDNITIPESVIMIYEGAFDDCSNLNTITLKCEPPKIITEVFSNFKGIIKYPCNSTLWTEDERSKWSREATWETGHEEAEIISRTDATCTESGAVTFECKDCGKTVSEIIPAGHIYDDWKTTIQATEITAGERRRTCKVCGNEERRIIDPLEPTLFGIVVTKPEVAKRSVTIKWKMISKWKQEKMAYIQIQYSTNKNFDSNVKTVTADKTATSKVIKKLKSKKTYYFRIRAYNKTNGQVHISDWSSIKAKVK